MTIVEGEFGVRGAAATAPLTTMASAMMFGTVFFAAAAMGVKSYVAGDHRAFQMAHNPKSQPLDVSSFASLFTLFYHLSIFGMILFYAYICEYHPPYPHAEKSYNRDEFFFMTALLFLVSFFTLTKNDKKQTAVADQEHSIFEERPVAPPNDKTEILNRDQTEEWKGWMQFMFLLYHYYHAEEVYNAIRIMITCYVWMTGFGNFSFFYLKGDYGSVRVMQMLWRLNFLVTFLCLTQGTTYILYYICLLHTYFFLMVYVVMRIKKEVNYTKWGIRIKLGCLALCIFVMWDLKNPLFRILHWPFLGETPMLGATAGAMWEWYFRSSLDHWSTFLGMIFALNFPITSLFFRKLEAQPLLWQVLAKGAMGVFFLGMLYWWVTNPFMHGKIEYNATNAYFGFIPLLVYIFFRNLTPTLRGYHLDLLHQIGKTTLETYLMQHHIWLTSDAKSLLTLIPGWPMMNYLVVTCIYFVLSRRLYQLTLFLRGMMLPNDRDKCVRNLVAIFVTLASYVALAFLLKTFHLLHLPMVAACSFVLGFILYQTVAKATTRSVSASPLSSDKKPNDAMGIAFASVLILVVGLIWHRMAQVGGAKIKPLPVGCQAFVNDGVWIPMDNCNEFSRGTAYRDHGTMSLGTCAGGQQTTAWGWKAPEPWTHCRFARRDPKSLKKALQHRRLVFIGDSGLRKLYHAVARQMGVAEAGLLNTTLSKHSDMERTVAKTKLEFKWAAYAPEQVEKLKGLAGASPQIDTIIMGGGAWDRLHKYGSDAEKTAFATAVEDLGKQIRVTRDSGVPVVWQIPTTINTDGLQTDEKKANIREEQMAEIRELYKSKNVLEAASFVLDGPAFSAGRVSESFDGVHYPFVVYEAGAQILLNAEDWLLPKRDTSDPFKAPQPGKMANPVLGGMMLCFVVMGLFFFDGFMGISYLASLFVPSVTPSVLYEEAFTALHQRAGLPAIGGGGSTPKKNLKAKSSDLPTTENKKTNNKDHQIDDDEIEALLAEAENSISNGTGAKE
ncbi:REDUCED WALL ACETYLATION [Seminavis robusta]|uniref:REDUCED WALL ACETYLATION n=1 Tax=Seminavis robusta TaxID=568900 RepID=A0A9N8HMZ0_9STRA|nr:REDUCED WALL ACETYLATION [Seminavis robusta]|eukprot:Sro1039_g234420.1 REDUCED WALL ACETYLATION (1006) ;mRNA; r:25286-28303